MLQEKLAIHGGPKAKTTPSKTSFLGGSRIGEEEKAQVLEVIDRKYLFRYYGPEQYPSKVRELEEKFAAKVGSKYALATTSCTGALISALIAVGVAPGDEVIVPGYTFFASCAAIVNANAIPVIAEVDETLTIDLADVERKITPNTKALIIVHMCGVPCDMDGVMVLVKKYNLKLIEDTAQACGGTYKGKYLGTFGDAGCFSFQYHKIITAGEGGMVVTDYERINDRAMSYHDTGACWRPDRFAEQRYEGELFCGTNYRMSELVGAVMLAQLDKLDDLLNELRTAQKRILDGIADLPGLKLLPRYDDEGDVGLYVRFYLDNADKVKPFVEALKAEGVDCGGVYNAGLPDWHIYTHWKHIIEKKASTPLQWPWVNGFNKGQDVEYSATMNPNRLEYLSRIVSLSMTLGMTQEDCDMIIKGIRKVAAVFA